MTHTCLFQTLRLSCKPSLAQPDHYVFISSSAITAAAAVTPSTDPTFPRVAAVFRAEHLLGPTHPGLAIAGSRAVVAVRRLRR